MPRWDVNTLTDNFAQPHGFACYGARGAELVLRHPVLGLPALVSSLARTPELAAFVIVAEAKDGAEGLVKLAARPDFVTTDVVYGPPGGRVRPG